MRRKTTTRRTGTTTAVVLPLAQFNAIRQALRTIRRGVRTNDHFIAACVQADERLTAVLDELTRVKRTAAIITLPRLR